MSYTAEQRERQRSAEARAESKVAQFDTLVRILAPEGFSVTVRRTVGACYTVGVSLLVGPGTRRDGFGSTVLEALQEALHGEKGKSLEAPAYQQTSLFEEDSHPPY